MIGLSLKKVVMKKEGGWLFGWRDHRATKTKRGRRGERILDDERCRARRRGYSSYPKIAERKRSA